MAKKRIQKKKAQAEKISSQKAETIKLETKKAEPIKVETKKTEPIKVETKKTEPVKVETKKTEPIKVETKKTEPVKVETKKTEPVKVGTTKTEPIKVEKKNADPIMIEAQKDSEKIYQSRFNRHYDELKWLYCELYQDNPYVMMHLNDLTAQLKKFYEERTALLKASDLRRENDPNWYKRNNLLGMMMYVDNFSDTLKGLEEKLDYIQ